MAVEIIDDVRSDRWVMTLNNYTEDDITKVKEFVESTTVILGIVEKEIGDSGTPHLQGYFVTDKKYHRSTISYRVGGKAYLAKAMGGKVQNWKYCTKEGPENLVIEKGYHLKENDPDADLKRFDELYPKMLTMSPMQFEIEEPKFMFYHRRQVMDVMIAHAECSTVWNGDLQKKNYWVWGATGTGKTMWAYQQCEGHHLFRKAVNKWWSGFDIWKHDAVIVDEWPAVNAGKEGLSDALCNLLKNWSDRYSFIGETKGGHVTIHPGKFILIVTSQYPINECFTNPDDILALQRRFHVINFKWIRKHPDQAMESAQFDERGELIEQMISVDWDVIKEHQ